jgi:chitin-binding protein
MSRYHKPVVAAAVAVLGLGVGLVVPPTPAGAHGAVSGPPSRVFACGPEGRGTGTAACQAAARASGTDAFGAWDEVRVPDVAGADREKIPDGKLCSGGIAAFAGLDLPRADWPATSLPAGGTFTFSYRTTIPHSGQFRLYLTRGSYRPTRPLTWNDLEARPFLTVDNPARRGDSYQFKGKLPAGRTGRHLIYTVWQNSDTPDTYYSCSDVVFPVPKPAATSAAAAPAPKPTPAATDPTATDPVATGTPSAGPVRTASTVDDSGPDPVLLAAAGGVGVLLLAGVALTMWARRERTHRPHRNGGHVRR